MTDQSAAGRSRTSFVLRLAACLLLLTGLLVARPVLAGRVDLPLQLEVSINGQPTQLIGGFVELNGSLATHPEELDELGLVVPDNMRSRPVVALDELPGVRYRFNAGKQTVDIEVGDEGRRRLELDVRGKRKLPDAQRGTGAVLNYALVGTLNDDNIERFHFDPGKATGNAAIQLDGRYFTLRGTLESSAIARSDASRGDNLVRLDTAWSSDNPDTLTRWRAGDTVTGALPWTRPIRLGGFQVQRSFGLRPDLVTAPLPTMTGSAAVPSTVDVYVNNVKSFSQAVPAGPFSIANLPIVSGAGTARIVVRDAAGRETTSEQAFFSSASLLAPGLYDYSLEAGLPRRNFGTLSDDYAGEPVASASARFGFQHLTLEGHAEGGMGLANAGVGAAAALGKYAVISGALSGSTRNGKTGVKVFGGLETQLFGISLTAQSQRAFGDYQDLASATAETAYPDQPLASALSYALTARPLRSLDVVSAGAPIAATNGSVNFSVIASGMADGTRQRIATASYSQPLRDNVSMFATGFRDLDTTSLGFFAGLSVGLGGGHNATIGASSDNKGTGFTADYVKASDQTPGTYGWRATVTRGATERSGAQVNWTTDVARFEAGAQNTRNTTTGLMVVTGSIAAIGGNMYFANRIDDSFAVVDAGAPGVDVMQENRRIGTTGADGRLLVPGLRAYETNKLAIDPLTLPLDVEPAETTRTVVPGSGTGLVVDIKGRAAPASAVVVLIDLAGTPLPVGSVGVVEASGETFIVGYDGETYLHGLAATNRVTVELDGARCRAEFDFAAPRRGSPGRVEGVICR